MINTFCAHYYFFKLFNVFYVISNDETKIELAVNQCNDNKKVKISYK